jgi:hypothetical protein
MSLRVVDIRHTGVVVTFEMDLDAMKRVIEGLDGVTLTYHGEGRQKECVTYLVEVFYKQLAKLVKDIEGDA